MKKSTIHAVLVAAAVAAAAFIGCTDVSNTTGRGVDKFLESFKTTNDSPNTPNANLDRISAVYIQTTIVYPSTSINTLKSDLTVTAYYNDNTTKALTPSDYQLSGNLAVGTSTVTVTHNGKNASFYVYVTESDTPPPPDAEVDSISAVYDSSEAVYSGTKLEDLKKHLTVTAHYDNGDTRVLGPSEYELAGELTTSSSVITVTYTANTSYGYVYETTTFRARLSVRASAAKLYAKAGLSDSTLVDLSYTSGTTVIDKAFSYVNENSGTYTFALESDIEITPGLFYTLSLTNPGTKLTIIGVGAERRITSVSTFPISMELGSVQTKNAPDMELTLGENVNFKGGEAGQVTIYTGTLKMQGNAKITDGSGVIVYGKFNMMDNAEIYGNSGASFAGGVAVLTDGVFTMEGDASVHDNVRISNSTDGAAGVYVGLSGSSSFTMKGNASVRNNNSGVEDMSGGGVGGVLVNLSGSFTMLENASVYDNIGYGVAAKGNSTILMSGSASVHGNKSSGARLEGGSLTMSDQASIHGNATTGTSSNGGGVYASSSSKFTMKDDASIYGNTAISELSVIDLGTNGGGVYITGGSEFAMNDNAKIYGNKAVGVSGSGGGVYIGYNGKFTMAGGTIYGLDATPETYKNTAGQSGASLFAENANFVKYGDGSNITASGNSGSLDRTITGKE